MYWIVEGREDLAVGDKLRELPRETTWDEAREILVTSSSGARLLREVKPSGRANKERGQVGYVYLVGQGIKRFQGSRDLNAAWEEAEKRFGSGGELFPQAPPRPHPVEASK